MSKNTKTELAVAGFFLLLFSLLGKNASADDYSDFSTDMPFGHMGQMGMGGHMGPHMGPMGMRSGQPMGPGWFSMLDLTKEQQKKINKLHDEMRNEHWKIMGEIMNLQSKLRDTYDADEPDPKAVGETYEKISQLRRKIIESKVETMNKARQLLTSEQRKQLKSGKRRFGWGGWGGGHMMQHRWSGEIGD